MQKHAGHQKAEGMKHKQPVLQGLMRKLTIELEAESRPDRVLICSLLCSMLQQGHDGTSSASTILYACQSTSESQLLT